MFYREAFTKKTDFFRSIRIDRDRIHAEGYLVTPMFGSVFERLINGLDGTGSRALSITGPYGTGKSAALLFAAELLSSRRPDLISLLAADRPDLIEHIAQLPPTSVLLINCLPERLGPQLTVSLQAWARPRKDRVLTRIVNHIDPHNIGSVVAALESVAERTHGFMVILDELGKLLEFAASHPADNDLFLLQVLAEEASRSPAEHPLMVVSVLHQSMDQYAHGLLKTQRDEFAKIQGRFEDMAFQVNLMAAMQLIGRAITTTRTTDTTILTPTTEHVARIADTLFELGMAPQGLTQDTFRSLCTAAAPLHPAVTLLLPPLFRQFAQNERSVFGFLGSSEPYGFQRFLDTTEIDPKDPQLYTLSHLYDYMAVSIGPSMYHGPYGRRWADLEDALHRVGDNPDVQALIKTLGLIDLVPGHGLVTSGKALPLLVGDPLERARHILENRGIVVYRRFSDSYRLWSGSDIDIEERIAMARSELGEVSVSELLNRLAPPKPIVARKYSMETGSLRWFELVLCEPDRLLRLTSDQKPPQADGRIYFILADPKDEKPPGTIAQHSWQVVCWINIPGTLHEAALELHYLQWVEEHTQEIADDATVGREIQERKLERERLIESTLDQILYAPEGVLDLWVEGKRMTIASDEFNRFLSDRCETLFAKSPRIHSEFVNRQNLSSAAAAGRNEVLRRMIDHAHEKALGITGFPPELPIYLATLHEGRLHQYTDGQWRLVAPVGGPWHETWAELTALIESQYQPLDVVWSHLSAPPFGIRAGLLPIVTLAFLLVNRNRLSLLEDETFVPEVTMPVMERLMKTPQRFHLRLTSLSGQQEKLVTAMVHQQLLPVNYDERDLLGLVRPLLAFAQKLPAWSKVTHKVTETAQQIRQVLLTAKEPADMLFRDLPRVLGYPAADDMSDEDIRTFTERLRTYIQELADAYPSLIHMIEERIGEAFGIEAQASLSQIRQTLRARSLRLLDVITDFNIKTVALRITQEVPDLAWVEGVASSIAGRPPKSWLDRTVQEFLNQVYIVARQFEHYETVVAAIPHATHPETVTRLGITTAHGDWETIVSSSCSQRKWAESAVHGILAQLSKDESLTNQHLLLLASELIKAVATTSLNKREDVSNE